MPGQVTGKLVGKASGRRHSKVILFHFYNSFYLCYSAALAGPLGLREPTIRSPEQFFIDSNLAYFFHTTLGLG
jgi:hypothetical protein